jgi:hypothetical protein
VLLQLLYVLFLLFLLILLLFYERRLNVRCQEAKSKEKEHYQNEKF